MIFSLFLYHDVLVPKFLSSTVAQQTHFLFAYNYAKKQQT